MYVIYTVFYWFLLIHPTNCYWVDPFDMLGYNHATKSRDQSANENSEGSQIPEIQACNSIEERNFIKRFINLILENSGITKENMQSGNTPSLLEVKIDVNKLKYLQNMLKSQNFSLQELDQTISSVIFPYKLQQSSDFSINIPWPSIETWHNIFMLSSAIFPFVAFFIFTGLKKIIVSTLVMLFAASYYIGYHKLLKEAEVNQYIALSKKIPDHCIGGDKWSFWGSMMSLLHFNDDSCTKHWHTLKIDARYHVTPIRVVAHIFSEPFLFLMENFGVHFSKFSNNIFSEVPWIYGPIVYVCACFLILIFGFGVIAMMSGQNTKLFGLQTFRRNKNVSRKEVILQRQMIEELLPVPNREGIDITIKGDSIEEISGKLNSCEQFKCNNCQTIDNDKNNSSIKVQNSDEKQPIQISEIDKDTLKETRKENFVSESL